MGLGSPWRVSLEIQEPPRDTHPLKEWNHATGTSDTWHVGPTRRPCFLTRRLPLPSNPTSLRPSVVGILPVPSRRRPPSGEWSTTYCNRHYNLNSLGPTGYRRYIASNNYHFKSHLPRSDWWGRSRPPSLSLYFENPSYYPPTPHHTLSHPRHTRFLGHRRRIIWVATENYLC